MRKTAHRQTDRQTKGETIQPPTKSSGLKIMLINGAFITPKNEFYNLYNCLYNCTETYLIYGLYIGFASSISREAGVIAYILSKKRVING